MVDFCMKPRMGRRTMALLRTLQLRVCGSVAGIAFPIPALYMLVVLAVLLAASLTAVSSTARRD